MYGAIVEPPMFIIVMGKVDCTLGGHEPTYIQTLGYYLGYLSLVVM